MALEDSLEAQVEGNTQPIKRKRGRPRKYPRLGEVSQAQGEPSAPSSPSMGAGIGTDEKLSLSPAITPGNTGRSEKLSPDNAQGRKSSRKVSPINRGREKVSQALPLLYSTKQITSKTALTLVQIYSQELTPEQITLLLDNREKLQLTHAELTALSLLEATETSEEARKQYWKIQETLERSKKPSTPVNKPQITLLEEKMSKAEEAIFGEIIEKPID